MPQAETMSRHPRITVPKTHIRQKVGTNNGMDLSKAAVLARPIFEKYTETFLETIKEQLSILRHAVLQLDGRQSGTREDRDRLYTAAHEIRGQGGMFGYPLATAVADVLCKVLDARPLIRGKDAPLIRLHLMALLAIFQQDLRADGGVIGTELRAVLELVVRHVKRAPAAR
jgi:hypothetical protein